MVGKWVDHYAVGFVVDVSTTGIVFKPSQLGVQALYMLESEFD